MTDFETVIPCAPVDLNKLPFVIRALMTNTDTSRVHVITPDVSKVPPLGGMTGYVSLHNDCDVLNVNLSIFKYRPKWVYQQFLKLFQTVTSTDWYLVIDADLLFNRPVSLFENGKPQFLLGHDQYHEPYFEFNKKMIGIGRVYNYSFLSECTLYDRYQINNMLEDNGYKSRMHFVLEASKVIDGGCYPAESELYGSYIYATQPDLYGYKRLKAALGGKYGHAMWFDDEIRARIDEIRPQDVDIFTIHSWEGAV